MDKCGFTGTPAITYSLVGIYDEWSFSGMGAVYKPQKNSFELAIKSEAIRHSPDSFYIMYTAHGPVC